MASVIREGGSNPIVITDWRTSLQVSLLEKMYDADQKGRYKPHFWRDFEGYINMTAFNASWQHELTKDDLKNALREMLIEGWIEASEFPCECCQRVQRTINGTLEHARRFRLTKIGYSKVPEHIFP